MRPDSLLRLWRYINHLLTYLHQSYVVSLERREQLARNFFDSTVQPRSCLHHLLPPPSDSILLSCLRAHSKYPCIPNRTNMYQSFISYALSKAADHLNINNACIYFSAMFSLFIVFCVFIVVLFFCYLAIWLLLNRYLS